MTENERKAAMQLFHAGNTATDIVLILGIPYIFVSQFLDGEATESDWQTHRQARSNREEVFSLPDIMKQTTILQLFRDGESYEDIARQVNLSYATIVKFLAQNEIAQDIRNQHRDQQQRLLDQAVDLYIQGVKLAEIFQETGVHASPLYVELRKRGQTPNRMAQTEIADASSMEGESQTPGP